MKAKLTIELTRDERGNWTPGDWSVAKSLAEYLAGKPTAEKEAFYRAMSGAGEQLQSHAGVMLHDLHREAEAGHEPAARPRRPYRHNPAMARVAYR